MTPPGGCLNHTLKKMAPSAFPLAVWKGNPRSCARPSIHLPSPEFAESFNSQIWFQKISRLSKPTQTAFRGQIPAANRSLHCRGPSGQRPITGEEKPFDAGVLAQPPLVHARLGRERGMDFLDDCGFLQLRFARCGQNLGQLAPAKFNDVLSRAGNQIVGGADYKLQVLPVQSWIVALCFFWTCATAVGFILTIQSRLVEDPLRRVLQKREKRLLHDDAIKP